MNNKKTITMKFSDVIIIGFIEECLNQGIEFTQNGDSLYSASIIYKAIKAGGELSVVFPANQEKNVNAVQP